MRPRLFFHLLGFEFRAQLAFRAAFWINALAGFVAEFGVTWFVWAAVFRESGKVVIGGYTFDGMVLYFLAVVLLGKIVSGREFEGAVSSDIYEGSLNRYLVLPASYTAFKDAQRIGFLGTAFVQFALFGLAAMLILVLPPGDVTWGSVARSAVATAAASVLYLGVAVAMGLVQVALAPPLWLATVVFVPGAFGSAWAGTWLSHAFALDNRTWGLVILAYCFAVALGWWKIAAASVCWRNLYL